MEDMLLWLRRRGISESTLEAFQKVDRKDFVPEPLKSHAYEDHPLRIGKGQTISQPYIVALMTDSLELTGEEKVLEVGTGSGYQAAILAELAREVWSIERHEELAEGARDKLSGVNVVVGDGSLGLIEEAPFDAIVVTAAAPSVPQPLIDQLADGGRMVIPVGDRTSQELLLVTKKSSEYKEKSLGACRFVPLKGEQAWK